MLMPNKPIKQFTSLPCASNTGGENPCIDTQDSWKASDCGRLGRQAAGHPWSALRVVKSCRKDCPTASVLPKPKQQLCIQSDTRAHYLNYLLEAGEAGKRSAGNRIGYQVIDRQVEDRQVEDRQVEDRQVEDRQVEDRQVEDRQVEDRQVEDRQVEDRQTGRNKA